MSVAAPTVLPILATPFGIVQVPGAEARNPALAQLFAQRASDGSQAKVQALDPLCFRSADDLLDWPDDAVRSLRAEILRGVYAVVGGVNEFSEATLRSFTLEARGWFTVVRTDGHVPATLYPLTAWCAIYCVAAPPPSSTRADSGVLRLYESRLATMFQDATNSMMRVPYRTSHYAWRPLPGEMAIFPASLTHEIAPLRAPGELILVTVRIRFVAPGQQGLGRW
jgi:hypothetical protein